jgi:hypothetical protein
MPDLRTLSTGTKILLGAGLLLFIDTFLAWQEVSVEVGGVEIASASRNAWHGFWGVVMGLALIALLVWVGLQIAKVEINWNLPAPERMITAGLAGLVFVLAVLKNLVDDYSAWPSYVGIVLAAAVAVGGWLRLQEPEPAAAPAEREPVPPPPPTTEGP